MGGWSRRSPNTSSGRFTPIVIQEHQQDPRPDSAARPLSIAGERGPKRGWRPLSGPWHTRESVAEMRGLRTRSGSTPEPVAHCLNLVARPNTTPVVPQRLRARDDLLIANEEVVSVQLPVPANCTEAFLILLCEDPSANLCIRVADRLYVEEPVRASRPDHHKRPCRFVGLCGQHRLVGACVHQCQRYAGRDRRRVPGSAVRLHVNRDEVRRSVRFRRWCEQRRWRWRELRWRWCERWRWRWAPTMPTRR